MKKLLTAVTLAVAATTASASNWIYMPVDDHEINMLNVQYLDKVYLPNVEKFSNNLAVYMTATYMYNENTRNCMYNVTTVVGPETRDGSLVIGPRNPTSRSTSFKTMATRQQCVDMYKQTLVDNSRGLYNEMIKNFGAR